MALPTRLLLRGAAALCLLLVGGCRSTGPPSAHLASDPPGARVWLNDVPTSWVTPCLIGLSAGSRHRVRLELEGFEPREILLVPGTDRRVVGWSAAELAPHGLTFPLVLSAQDLFQPVRLERGPFPSRVHVRLRQAAPPAAE